MSDRWTALVTHALAAGLSVRCTATGQSMEPAILDGETIVVEPVRAEALAVGMVVLAEVGGRTLVHRVIALERDASGALAGVRMQGDALSAPDPSGKPQDIRGRVTAVMRDGAELPLSLLPTSRWSGFAPMACLATAVLAVMSLIVLRMH